MDNVTHTLVGLAMGEGLVRASPRLRATRTLSRATILASVLANNAPDLDFIQTLYIHAGKLGYLLFHRGQTHTILAIPFLAAFCAVLAALAFRIKPGGGEWGKIYAVSALGVGAHVLADFGNDYGVHPFWPAWNGWIYGGYLFIIEPWVWVVLIPVLIFVFRSRWIRAGGIALSFLLQALIWGSGALSLGVAIFLSLAQLLFLVLGWKKPGLKPAWIALGVVLLAFIAGSLRARAEIWRQWAETRPHEEVLQIATSPAPGNPLCWRTIVVAREGDAFFERIGARSLAPALISPENCFLGSRALQNPAAFMNRPPSVAGNARQIWVGEFQGSVRSFEALARSDCQFAALLRFARIPYWEKRAGGMLVSGDARYGFTERETSSSTPCPTLVPPWSPPSRISAQETL